jgi:hypothetical protein
MVVQLARLLIPFFSSTIEVMEERGGREKLHVHLHDKVHLSLGVPRRRTCDDNGRLAFASYGRLVALLSHDLLVAQPQGRMPIGGCSTPAKDSTKVLPQVVHPDDTIVAPAVEFSMVLQRRRILGTRLLFSISFLGSLR